MADTTAATCPNCQKRYQLPANLAGKTIRCKACQATFAVPGGAKPATAKPVAAKPVVAKPAADAPLKFADDPPAAPKAAGGAALPGQRVARPQDDDDDEGSGPANPYGVTADALDVPRCPFCATELDPPDTKICLRCGYDLMERRRHATKKVYETTPADYALHWLPAVAWIIVAIIALTIMVLCWLYMGDWLTGSFLDKGEKNPITDKPTFYLEPIGVNLPVWLLGAFLIFKGVKFSIKRLVFDWRPREIVKKS